MEENKNEQEKQEQINQKIIYEYEKTKKKLRFLRVICYMIVIILLLTGIALYKFYKDYKQISNTMQELTNTNYQDNENLIRTAEIISQNLSSQTIENMESPSLSKIRISKEIAQDLKEENIKALEQASEEFAEDRNIQRFIEKLKNDPDMKDIILASPKERPQKLLEKMKDQNFMQKLTNYIMGDPELLKSLMKMTTDPRIQKAVQELPRNINKNTINKNKPSN